MTLWLKSIQWLSHSLRIRARVLQDRQVSSHLCPVCNLSYFILCPLPWFSRLQHNSVVSVPWICQACSYVSTLHSLVYYSEHSLIYLHACCLHFREVLTHTSCFYWWHFFIDDLSKHCNLKLRMWPIHTFPLIFSLALINMHHTINLTYFLPPSLQIRM